MVRLDFLAVQETQDFLEQLETRVLLDSQATEVPMATLALLDSQEILETLEQPALPEHRVHLGLLVEWVSLVFQDYQGDRVHRDNLEDLVLWDLWDLKAPLVDQEVQEVLAIQDSMETLVPVVLLALLVL